MVIFTSIPVPVPYLDQRPVVHGHREYLWWVHKVLLDLQAHLYLQQILLI